MGRSNLAAFRAFLLAQKTRLDQKTCVTRVTCVTTKDNNDLAGYTDLEGRVTCVTASASDLGPAEAETLERQAIAEIDGGVPAVFSGGFARLQLTPPSGLSVQQWLLAVDDVGRFLDVFGARLLPSVECR